MPQDQNDIKGVDAMKQAPTAPVEASGSEREGIMAVIDRNKCEPWTVDRAGQMADEILNLRPQPSGERDIASQNEASGVLGWFSALARKEGHHVQADWLDSYIASIRPAPVSSGGQHSSGEGERAVMVCPQCEGEGEYADGVDEPACSTPCTRCDGNGWLVDLVSLANTPVAETAGEADGLRRAYEESAPFLEVIPDRSVEGCYRTVVHAAPVPAQDDDKLRIACETARDALKCEGPEHELIYQRDRFALDRIATGPNLQRAIAAALKSTAAQEGGE